VLVIFPSLFTVAFTSMAIFAAMRHPEELEDSQRSIVETDQNFIVCLFVLISFLLAWLPLVAVQFIPVHWVHPDDSAHLNFAFMWLAIGGGSAKLLIYSTTNAEYRKSFFSTCLRGRRRRRRRMEENGARLAVAADNSSNHQQQQQQIRHLDEGEDESGVCSSGPYMVVSSSAAQQEFLCAQTPNQRMVSSNTRREYGSFARSPY
jgi:hypothetical protein